MSQRCIIMEELLNLNHTNTSILCKVVEKLFQWETETQRHVGETERQWTWVLTLPPPNSLITWAMPAKFQAHARQRPRARNPIQGTYLNRRDPVTKTTQSFLWWYISGSWYSQSSSNSTQTLLCGMWVS